MSTQPTHPTQPVMYVSGWKRIKRFLFNPISTKNISMSTKSPLEKSVDLHTNFNRIKKIATTRLDNELLHKKINTPDISYARIINITECEKNIYMRHVVPHIKETYSDVSIRAVPCSRFPKAMSLIPASKLVLMTHK